MNHTIVEQAHYEQDRNRVENILSRRHWLPRLTVVRPNVLHNKHGNEILERIKNNNVPIKISDSSWEAIREELSIKTEATARNILILELNPIKNVRREEFPDMSTRDDYYFGTQGINCPYRCEYCYLYANSKGIVPLTLYVDLSETYAQVNNIIQESSSILTFNFGEDTDSLAVEHITGTAKELINFFSQSKAHLELRTKSGLVNTLLNLDHRGRTTIGISITPSKIAEKYEHLTARIEDRLYAGSLYLEAGYNVALNFEPGILIENWENLYTDLVRSLPRWFEKNQPTHISLGCFRYRAELKDAMLRNYPHNDLIQNAKHQYVPNRYSYDISLRKKFYQLMINEIHKIWTSIPIYLSMESEDLCNEFGANPWIYTENEDLIYAQSSFY